MTTAAREEQSDDVVVMAAASFAIRRHFAAHPTARVHQDDVVSDAHFGAATAFTRYDPAGGASLFTYALRRATGAIVDGLRTRSPMTRGEYAAADDPSDEVGRRTPLSLEVLAESGWTPPAPSVGVDQVDDVDEVLSLLHRLPTFEQFVLVAVTMYGFSQTEVASWLGVTPSRVNSLERKGLDRLRARLVEPA